MKIACILNSKKLPIQFLNNSISLIFIYLHILLTLQHFLCSSLYISFLTLTFFQNFYSNYMHSATIFLFHVRVILPTNSHPSLNLFQCVHYLPMYLNLCLISILHLYIISYKSTLLNSLPYVYITGLRLSSIFLPLKSRLIYYLEYISTLPVNIHQFIINNPYLYIKCILTSPISIQ